MSEDNVSVEVTRRLPAPPDTVFDAWFDPENLGRWLFATAEGRMERVEVDPRVGGRFEIDRPRRLAFDFGTSFEATPTRVTVTIVPDGEGSLLTLRHEGVWSDWEDRTRHGWDMILGNLERTLG